MTQPISAAALPLPSGAATDAKLEALRALLAAPLTIQGNICGSTAVAAAPFTRPANTTAYAAGQLVANSATAARSRPCHSRLPARPAAPASCAGLA